MAQNPNPDLRRQYREDMGTDMFQRLQVYQSENNVKSIEELNTYFISKVKPI
jgi:hypothetical protein